MQNAYTAAPELGLCGKWAPEVRMSGLETLARGAAHKTVLDLGCAEGLIALRFLQDGAALVHGFDLVPDRITAAREICRGFANAKFWQADLSDWRAFWACHASNMLHRYDIVLYLGLHHHLPAKARIESLRNAAGLSSDVLALRMPETNYGEEDVQRLLVELGFRLVTEHWNRDVPDLGPLRIFARSGARD